MRRLVATVGLVLILAPAPAWADGLIIPFAGAVFDPETNELLGRETEPTYGAAVGFMVDGKLGFEYDFSYTSKFFPESQGFTDNRLMTSMFNVIYGVPIGEYPEYGPGFRPYGSGGVGIMTISIDNANGNLLFRDNDFGVNVGGGIIGFLNDTIGFRGDIR